MDQIKELGNILQKERPDLYDNLAEADSKKGMLFRAVMESIVRTDNESSMLIYGKVDDGKKYQMLKRNLKEHLIDLLNSIDYKTQINLLQIENELKEKVTLAGSILSNNVFHYAEKLINQVYKKAENFFLYNILADCASMYININSIKGYPKRAEKWAAKFNEYYSQAKNHKTASNYLQITQSYFIHFCSLNVKQATKIRDHIYIVDEWIKENTSPFLKLYRETMMIYKYYHDCQLDKITSQINKIDKLLIECPYLSHPTLEFNLLLQKAKVAIAMEALDLADEIILETLNKSDYKSFLRFEAQALLFNLCLKRNQLVKADNIIEEVFNTYEFSLFYPEAKAAWLLRKAYLFFYIKGEKREKDFFIEETSGKSNFVKELDHVCKNISKDKQGYNVQYLIIRQLLSWINHGNGAYNNGKNLQLYYYRNLKQLSELRIKLFFKCLSNIAINDFSEQAILDQERAFYKNLRETKYDYRYDPNEIIPFDEIFRLLVKNKEDKK